MNREILFRGKSTTTGEWVYGYYQEYPEGYVHIQNAWNDWFPVIPESVGQFTGIVDMNGVKIFEGDYIKLDDVVKRTFETHDGYVWYNHGTFFIHNNRCSMLDSLHTLVDFNYVMRGKVIGNIHDNPELLKLSSQEFGQKESED